MVLSIFSARLTSNLAVKKDPPLVDSLKDVHSKGYNLYIAGMIIKNPKY